MAGLFWLAFVFPMAVLGSDRSVPPVQTLKKSWSRVLHLNEVENAGQEGNGDGSTDDSSPPPQRTQQPENASAPHLHSLSSSPPPPPFSNIPSSENITETPQDSMEGLNTTAWVQDLSTLDSSPPPHGWEDQANNANFSRPIVIKVDFFNALFKLLTLSWLTARTDGGGLRGILSAAFTGGVPAHVIRPKQHYAFEVLNDRYSKDKLAVGAALCSSPDNQKALAFSKAYLKKTRAQKKQQRRRVKKGGMEQKRTTIVMEVKDLDRQRTADGNVRPMEYLRDSISFILTTIRDPVSKDVLGVVEIVLLLESTGGAVPDFGLASNQLERLRRDDGISNVTICVDKVAASGGYMIACLASPGCLIAAPFATLGSIGVVAQAFNVRNVLERWGISPFVIKGGKHKATLDMFGEVTDEDVKHERDKVEGVHQAFRSHVERARPQLTKNLEKVSNGEVWLGEEALDLGLVDKIMTSDQYIFERVQAGDRVLRLHHYDRFKSGFGFSPLDLMLKKKGPTRSEHKQVLQRAFVDIISLLSVGRAIMALRRALSPCG